MIAKLVIASLLAGTSAASVGQGAPRTADASTNQWARVHQCTLAPVNNFTVTNTGSVTTGSLRIAGEITMTRIDLQVSGSPGGSPTITAFAINTKGTGHSSGRMSSKVRNQQPIGVDCVSSQLSGDAAAQKATMVDFHLSRGGAKSVGWSCSVSGSEDKPVFSVGLLVPTILGQAERAAFSWGMSNGRMSIVPRGAVKTSIWNVPCASKTPRGAGYDLVMMKKA